MNVVPGNGACPPSVSGSLRGCELVRSEAYYNWQIKKGINITFDAQGVNDPAYNLARGPIAIFGVRVHFEY
ncbi:MAG TPA: carbohydrate porin [Gemmataceae bacterium]|jgi:hypothetical protein|nr:carbohydrate porin [Gemmataceae bacterium]